MTPAKGYMEMKDSGIEWIEAIPAHWDILRGKNVLRLLERPVKPEDDVVTCFRDGEVTLRKNRREEGFTNSLKEIGYQGIEPGDLIVHGMDGFAGAIGISDSRGKASPVLNVMDSNQNKRYLMYYLRAMAYKDVFMALSTGIRVRSCDLRWNKLSVFPFLIPKSHEQSAIAAYLDTQCAKIDEIIAQAKASIEDYKQWKMSVVNDAVTHGLDPNAEMKDSGIYWMGKIPTKWGLKRLKYIFAIKKDIAGELGHTVLAITQQGIKPKNMSDKGQFALDYSKYQLVVPGDFAMNHMDLLTGWVDISQYSGVTSPDYRVFFALHPEEIDTNYYKHVFQTCYRCRIFYGLGQGVSGLGRWRLPAEMFLNFVLPVPPLDEQRKIGEFLDKQCAKIDDLIIEKQSLIDDLESYKKSFIYEVVTGKRRIAEPDQMTIAVLSPDILRYQKALLMLRILDLLGNKARGRIHLQKCMFAAECLLNIPFQTQYIRYDHGPYDLHLADYETVLCDSGWFNIQKGSHVTYQKSRHFAEGLKEYMNVFSDIDEKLKHIVAFLKPMKTTQAERVATLLAAWNDFIIDGISHPTDKEIINEVMSNWTPNKANPQYSTWQDTLTKIRKNRFIPSGFGIHTLKKEVLLQEE